MNTTALPMEDPDEFDRRPEHRRMRIYLPALVVIGLAGLALVYLLAMQGLGWSLEPSPDGTRAAASPLTRNHDAVHLYASPTTRAYFSSVGGNYDVLLDAWRKYFQKGGSGGKEVAEVEALAKLEGGVLVLPSAVALNDAERQAILAFRARGGAVLATWATGTRSSDKDWAGWEFLEKLGSARFSSEIQKGNTTIGFLIANGEAPVSHTLPAGQRIWLGNNAESLLNLKAAPGARIGARFMNWARATQPERREEGAVIYADHAPEGRSVVFGFAETTWEYQPHLIQTLIDDTLDWLQRRPAVLRAAWPDGRSAAQIIEMDTEAGFPNALRLADMMRSVAYRGTYYILTSVAIEHPEILRALAHDFEIAYHGDIHISFKDQSADEQKQRIANMRQQMASVLGDIQGFTGFRAPTEGYDQTTENLLHAAGIRHHLADPHGTEARLPIFDKIDPSPEQDLVILPRTQRDDINLLGEGLDLSGLTRALIDDFDLARDQAALGILSVHTQNFGEGQPLALAMPALFAHIKQHRAGVWLAGASEVANWWRTRERFSVTGRDAGQRVELEISVRDKAPVNGGTAIVILPRKGAQPSVRGAKSGMPRPEVRLLDPYRAALVFDTLPPGDYLYQITF